MKKLINLPGNVSLTGNPTIQGMTAGTSQGSSDYRVHGKGIHWDTCARYTLLPTAEAFVSWDAPSKATYTIVGAVGNTTSSAAGKALIGLKSGKQMYWYPVKAIYVQAMTEPLVGAVDVATEWGIDTQVSKGASCIKLPDGTTIPLDISTGVTRCTHIELYNPSVHGDGPRLNYTTKRTREPLAGIVTARAATLVDRVRMMGSSATDDDRFMAWTKRCCGLAPEAVSHLQENSVGCDAPSTVPRKYRDLKWYPSAIAGKLRASSHPPREHLEITRFRQVVAMDFLEFTVHTQKMHVHAFVDYHTTHAYGVVVKSRATAHQNVMSYLNATEEYVKGETVMRCVHDRAREYLSKRMNTVAIYSKVVKYATVPYLHAQNGKIERFNQTLQRMVIVSLHDSNVPMEYTVYLVEFCIRLYNMVPVKSLGWKSRMEAATGAKPDFSRIFRFGCLCRVLKPLETRTHKFDAHSQDCVYLGPCPLGGGTRYLPLDTRRVLVRKDVVVYSDVMPFRTAAARNVSLTSSRSLAQDVAEDIAWWEPEGETLGEDLVDEGAPAPRTPETSLGQQRNKDGVPHTPVPMHTMQSQHTPSPGAGGDQQFTPSPGGTATGAYSPFSPTRDRSQVMKEMRKAGHCSNTECTLPYNHPGLCNNTVGYHPNVSTIPSVPPAGATRGARMQLSMVPEQSEACTAIAKAREEEG